MKQQHTISNLSRGLLFLAALLLVGSLFLPIWKIELYAPQYPEGLALSIYANRLGGDVEVINGLNHYIGMRTLHTEDFIEFSILRYILGFFILIITLAAWSQHRKVVMAVFISFVSFCLVALLDFYRWNYNYGHNLDPSAAIKVPGMSYQPPVLGYKQLLNFGAYSIPDTGGLLMTGTGLLLLFVILFEWQVLSRWFGRKKASLVSLGILAVVVLSSCTRYGPKPLSLNEDMCAYCKMTITSARFATQLQTQKGRHYMFDDLSCMAAYAKENAQTVTGHFYVADFSIPDDFVDIQNAVLLKSDSLRSPMAGNMAGFAVRDSAERYKAMYQASEITWDQLTQ